MWNKGLSYRERHGILNMDTKQDEATSSTINKAKYHHSLGLVFFPAFDWKISETHPERQERLLYTRDQIVEEGLLDIPNIREYNPIVADWDTIERSRWRSRFRVLGDGSPSCICWRCYCGS